MKTIKLIWLVLFLFCIAYSAYMYDKLPEKIATHFNFSGEVDHWSSKQDFFLLLMPIIVLINCLLFCMVTWISKIPESLVNLTWKDFWFSTPERKTLAYQKLKLILAVTAILVNGTFAFILYMTCYVSLAQIYTMPLSSLFVWIILGTFVIFLVWIFYYFYPPKQDFDNYKKNQLVKK